MPASDDRLRARKDVEKLSLLGVGFPIAVISLRLTLISPFLPLVYPWCFCISLAVILPYFCICFTLAVILRFFCFTLDVTLMFFLFYACFTLVLPWGNLWGIKSFSSRFFGCQIVNTLVILPFSYNQLITSNGLICPCF